MKSRLKLILAFLLFSVHSLFAQQAIRLSHQPYLQAMTDSSVSIVWTSNKAAIAWVELALDGEESFYSEERPKFHASEHGFKKVGTVHQVQLKDLKTNTRYRVYAQEVLKHQGTQVEYGRVAATNVYSKKPLSFKTNGAAITINFSVINDMHSDNDLLKSLIKQAELEKTESLSLTGIWSAT